MVYADGRGNAAYAVMRGKMIGRAFDCSTAETLAIISGDGSDRFYREASKQYATKDAPPVYWQK
jgi:hypothetical protein